MRKRRIWAIVFTVVGIFFASGGMDVLATIFVWHNLHVNLKEYYHPSYDIYLLLPKATGFVLLILSAFLWFVPSRPK